MTSLYEHGSGPLGSMKSVMCCQFVTKGLTHKMLWGLHKLRKYFCKILITLTRFSDDSYQKLFDEVRCQLLHDVAGAKS